MSVLALLAIVFCVIRGLFKVRGKSDELEIAGYTNSNNRDRNS